MLAMRTYLELNNIAFHKYFVIVCRRKQHMLVFLGQIVVKMRARSNCIEPKNDSPASFVK